MEVLRVRAEEGAIWKLRLHPRGRQRELTGEAVAWELWVACTRQERGWVDSNRQVVCYYCCCYCCCCVVVVVVVVVVVMMMVVMTVVVVVVVVIHDDGADAKQGLNRDYL